MVCFFLGDRNALFYKYFIKHLLKRLCRAGCDIKATVSFRVLEANIINMFSARPGRTDQISINNQRSWTLCVSRCSLGLKTWWSIMVPVWVWSTRESRGHWWKTHKKTLITTTTCQNQRSIYLAPIPPPNWLQSQANSGLCPGRWTLSFDSACCSPSGWLSLL